MTTSTIQFVTRTKLAELSRQRETLLEQYRAAEQAGADESAAGLKALYEGLKRVRIAQVPLHRDLPDLAVLLEAADPPESIVSFWRQQLQGELQRGRLRAEVVYLFGASLGEWDRRDEVDQALRDQRKEQRERLLREATSPPDHAPPLKLLGERLATLSEHHAEVARKIEEQIEESVQGDSGCYPHLPAIAENPHHPAETRAEARRFSRDAVLESQFTDALRVVTRDPRDWSWPAEGVETRAEWTRNKWRLYPALSLIELAILQAHAEFWSGALGRCYSHTGRMMNRQGRLQKLEDLGAPAVITANERRMLQNELQLIPLSWYEPVDPWTAWTVYEQGEPVRGVFYQRANAQCALRDASQQGYGYGEGTNAVVQQVHAEVQLLRAAFPDRPLHVVKLDIQDFFASVPHESLLAMLRGLGMPASGIEFVERYLAIPFRIDGRPTPARRGVPMEQPLSHWLCEWLLRMMEEFVHLRARVRIVRQIDDICLLAPDADNALAGWNAVRDFLADCGLAVNEEKCGAVTIGGEPVTGLPTDGPCWGLLELTPEGDWRTHEPSFERLLEDARREVDARHAVLAKVGSYNENLKFLLSAVGLAMDLGDRHRESAGRALSRFESQFFGDGVSVVEGLRRCIADRHRDRFDTIPTSWLVWPITAGGLGLRSATVLAGQYQLAYKARGETRKAAPEVRGEDWQRGDESWAEYYEDLMVALEPAECSESPRMKTMVQSFIRRGKSISGGAQQGLTQYWRWILSVYGPEILDRLGTFEFLLTELVPLQLIQEKLLDNDGAGGNAG